MRALSLLALLSLSTPAFASAPQLVADSQDLVAYDQNSTYRRGGQGGGQLPHRPAVGGLVEATTGDKQHVFNGICGAESGSVPVSTAAPAMLFSEMEVQKRAHGHERPPILPAPGVDRAANGAKSETSAGVKP